MTIALVCNALSQYDRLTDEFGIQVFVYRAEQNVYSTYFKFCHEKYDVLPEYILFMHGHDKSWHQSYTILSVITQVRFLLSRCPTPYINLNNHLWHDWYYGGSMTRNVRKSVKYLNLSWELPQTIRELSGGQACVHRSLIRQRTRQFWKEMYEKTRYVKYHSSIGYGVEGIFHVLMGQPWNRDFVERHWKSLYRWFPNRTTELQLRLNACRME